MSTTVNTITEGNPQQSPTRVEAASLIAPIVGEIVSAVVERYRHQLRAVVLTGSMAREEATFIAVPGGWKVLGDCEMVLVFHANHPLPPAAQVAGMVREVERRLEQLHMPCEVGLSPVHPNYLSSLPPHIYGYELRRCGRVLWGNPRILNLIPAFSPGEIPREDAWRMVCNRMIEQLVAAEQAGQSASGDTAQADYRTVKLCLDLATALLLFCGEYAPSYQQRSARLLQLAEGTSTRGRLPFPLPPFAALVQRLTRWKLAPDAELLGNDPSLLPAVWGYARALWRWQVLQLTGEREERTNSELMRRWMQSQPVHHRIRGWASVARKQGWSKSWREWPRWARLGMQSSPRYWVYAAGSELFFRLPSLLGHDGAAPRDQSVETLRGWLPVPASAVNRGKSPWQQLAFGIRWNYRQFLMETCS